MERARCEARHSCTCSIVPPYMIDAMKLRGDSETRKMAQELAVAGAQVRDARLAAEPEDVSAQVAALVGGGGTTAGTAAGLTLVTAASDTLQRHIYDGQMRAALPGQPARDESEPAVQDQAVNDAYDAAGATYAFFSKAYGRASLDGKNLPLVLTVHHRRNHNNAYWNGTQMLFGDGDGSLFVVGGFSSSLSVVGHELAHGVVQFSGGLVYSGESGALNEHVADVFGALTEQYTKHQQAHEATWLIGEHLVANGGSPMSLRSLEEPGTAYRGHPILGDDPQPYHMRDYVHTLTDEGGVHINSGIPNHAFFLVARALKGFAWERAGQIWYDALLALNQPHATFQTWARATAQSAARRYGVGSIEERAVHRAWRLVGLT